MAIKTIVAPEKIEKKYYVYELAYPESMGGKVFYVGKGKGDRIHMHEHYVLTGDVKHSGNTHKDTVIRRIIDSGQEITKRKVAFFDAEMDALIYEWFLINICYGIKNLTNMTSGGTGWHIADEYAAAQFSAKEVSQTLDVTTYDVATMQELRKQAGLSAFQLAVESGLSLSTVQRMETNKGISRLNAYRILNVLSEKLGRTIALSDIEDLKVSD